MALLTQDDHARVSAAIAQAESQTDGEIYAVLAQRSDDYFASAALVITLAANFGAFLCAVWMYYSWVQADTLVFISAFVGAWASALVLLWFFPSLASGLLPRRLLYKRAHQNAARQFLAHNIHRTNNRTGVLLFVSVQEKYAEVYADSAINSLVAQHEWDAIVSILIDHAQRQDYANGFLTAITASSALLAKHFPKSNKDRNELDDHVVEL